MKTTDDLIRSYYDWLKAKTAWREINDSVVRHFTPIFAPFRKVPPAPARV